MKYLYWLTIFVIIVVMAITITLFVLGKVCGYYLPISIIFINGITLIVVFVEKVFAMRKENLTIPQLPIAPIVENTEDIDLTKVPKEEDKENDLERWSNAMYNRFSERWQNLYDHIEYPADKASKAEISVLSWEIASLTMDYLMMVNNSPNLLERHKESVSYVINELKYQDMGLKTFYEDPTTVPAKVLAVYNTLDSQLAARQSFETNIFGYYVVIPNK